MWWALLLNSIVSVLNADSVIASSYESIATTTLTTTAGSITFSSIPATYKHLQIRYSAQGAGVTYGKITFNSDTSTNYYTHLLEGDGATAVAAAYAGSTFNAIVIAPGGFSSTANIFNAGIIDILDYTSTNKNKTIRALQGYDTNGSGYIDFSSGSWSATPAAITSITITNNLGNFTQYSKFALYGIKGA